MNQELTIQLPKLHQAQQQIHNEAARFNVVDCGRRFGKTTMGQNLLVPPALDGAPVGWFSPTYKMLIEVWRAVNYTLRPIASRINAQERRIELLTGGVIEMWSLDNPDIVRGRKYKRVIVDEAALVKNLGDAWNTVLRPTLMDMRGDGWFFSTPKGHNFFWQMFQWGQDSEMDEWQCWQMPTSANPFIPPEEIEALRRSLPERIFAQEVLAVFLDDAGGVFRGVMDAATATPQDKRQEDHDYIFGVDWGKHNDFTVITVLDTANNEMVAMDRFNQIDYSLQLGRLKAMCERFQPSSIIAERNSMGDPLVEQLLAEGLPVQAFTTTNASKAQAIQALSLAFERKTISILNDPVLIGELQAFEAKRLPSGMLRYEAPEGMHDDTVMALAMGWHGASRTFWYAVG